MWSLCPVLPQSLGNILETTADDLEERNEQNETDKDEEMDFEQLMRILIYNLFSIQTLC